MRNPALQPLDMLVGTWKITTSDAWFLEPGTITEGEATFEWIGDAFVVMRSTMRGEPAWDFVFGRSDATEQLVALYHDERGVCRVFAMTFTDEEWTMVRRDPDMHQQLVFRVERDRLVGRTDASDDDGATWRKDFDLVFERR